MRTAHAKEVRVTSKVSEECWIELKVYAVRQRISLADAVQQLLEKAMTKRKQRETQEDK